MKRSRRIIHLLCPGSPFWLLCVTPGALCAMLTYLNRHSLLPCKLCSAAQVKKLSRLKLTQTTYCTLSLFFQRFIQATKLLPCSNRTFGNDPFGIGAKQVKLILNRTELTVASVDRASRDNFKKSHRNKYSAWKSHQSNIYSTLFAAV